jgi:PAS domain S-box-containing protein
MNQKAMLPSNGRVKPGSGAGAADTPLDLAIRIGDLMGDGIVVLDPQERIIQSNAAFGQLFGYAADEVHGRRFDILYAEDDSAAQHATNPAQDTCTDVCCRHRDGTIFFATRAITLLSGVDGAPAGSLLVHRPPATKQPAKAARQSSEIAFRTLFELSLVGTAEVAPTSGRLLKVNAKMGEITGYSTAELQTMTFRELTHPEDRDKNWEGFRRTMTGSSALYVVEKRYIRKDGGIVWVRVQSAPQRDAHGIAQRTVSMIQDITLQKQAEAALRQQLEMQALLGKIMATVPGAIYSYQLRPDGSICMPFASAALVQLFGIAPEAVRDDASCLMERIHPQDIAAVRRSIAVSYEAMTPWRAEFRAIHPDKGELWIDGHSVPQREADGSVLWHGYLSDITNRKVMEQTLRQREADLRRAQSVAQTGSWQLNVRKNELHWSDENHRIFGVPRGIPLTYESFLAVTHPEDRDFVDHSWQAALLGAPYDIEHRIVVADETRWVRQRAELEFDAQGNLLGGFGSTQDITELKRAAAALAASEARFRLAMEAVAGVVYEWHRASGATYWSSGLARIFGVSGLDAENSRAWWRHNIHPEDLPRVRAEIRQAQKAGDEQLQMEYRMRHGAGYWLHVADGARIIRDGNGRLERVVGSLTEISARKQAEAELRRINDSLELVVARRTAEADARAVALQESERFARATIDALDFALCVLDDSGHIIAVNRIWREFARSNGGDERLLCEGADYLAVCTAAAGPSCPVAGQVADAVRAAIAGGRQSFSVEYECHAPYERRWFVMHLSAFPSDGPLRLVIKHEEISARKLAEEERLASARRIKRLAAHLETVREEQSASIAREVHDELGGTLTMVKLGLAMIGDTMEQAAPQHAALNRILDQVSAALQTVKRISTNLRPATLDTLGFIATVKWYAAQFSQMTGIATQLHMPAYVSLPRSVATTTFRIVQEALTNIAKHARAGRVIITIERRRQHLFIIIRDDGIGLSEASQAEPDSFGLIGMHERAQNLGGQLTISSPPGAGTRLDLSIPLGDNDVNGESPA